MCGVNTFRCPRAFRHSTVECLQVEATHVTREAIATRGDVHAFDARNGVRSVSNTRAISTTHDDGALHNFRNISSNIAHGPSWVVWCWEKFRKLIQYLSRRMRPRDWEPRETTTFASHEKHNTWRYHLGRVASALGKGDLSSIPTRGIHPTWNQSSLLPKKSWDPVCWSLPKSWLLGIQGSWSARSQRVQAMEVKKTVELHTKRILTGMTSRPVSTRNLITWLVRWCKQLHACTSCGQVWWFWESRQGSEVCAKSVESAVESFGRRNKTSMSVRTKSSAVLCLAGTGAAITRRKDRTVATILQAGWIHNLNLHKVGTLFYYQCGYGYGNGWAYSGDTGAWTGLRRLLRYTSQKQWLFF